MENGGEAFLASGEEAAERKKSEHQQHGGSGRGLGYMYVCMCVSQCMDLKYNMAF
jgi:hypothetical protein